MLLYALIAAVLTSILPIINKRLLTDTDVSVVSWAFNALSLPILGVSTWLLSPAIGVDSLFWIGVVGSGMLNMIATLVSTQALKLGDASLVVPFLTFNPVFTLVVALFVLREIPTANGVAGVLLIAAGAYLFALREVNVGFAAPLKALLRQRGVLFAILASFIWGLTPILEKIAIQHSSPENPPLVAFSTTLVMSLFLLPVMLFRNRSPFRQIEQHRRGFFVAALIAGIAPLFGFTAIATAQVAYVTAIFKLSTVFTVLLAYMFLRERQLGERVGGAILMTAGAILLGL